MAISLYDYLRYSMLPQTSQFFQNDDDSYGNSSANDELFLAISIADTSRTISWTGQDKTVISNYFQFRYVQNNFLDGARQDSYDILVGNHRYSTVEESPLAKPRHPVAIFLPAVIGIFIALLILKV